MKFKGPSLSPQQGKQNKNTHQTAKLLKDQRKRGSSEGSQKEKNSYIWNSKNKNIAEFSSKTMLARQQWNNICEALKEKSNLLTKAFQAGGYNTG